MSSLLSAVPGVLLTLGGLPVASAAAYLGVLTCVARRWRGRRPSDVPPRFDIIVPAHDEEQGIAATVASLLALDYPRSCYRVLVVADNCTDGTADAAARAGARVLVRTDATKRGKGYALAHGFDASIADAFATAVVVVDADTIVSSNLLSALAVPIAAAEHAAQVHYGVLNVNDSWRTRLMALAFALFHTVRSLGRERLRLSCGLRGNGMAFTHDLLRRVPYAAFSVVEDLEYGIQLGLAGVRVAYVPEAEVLGEMPDSERAAGTQRDRWEQGRRGVAKRYLPMLMRQALARRSALCFDLAADLLVPPLSQLVVLATIGAAAAALAAWFGLPMTRPAVALWGGSIVILAGYIARGCSLSGLGPSVLLDLLRVPGYIAWKYARKLRPSRASADEWVRTARTAKSRGSNTPSNTARLTVDAGRVELVEGDR